MMKRVFAMILAAAMVFAMAACSLEEKEAENKPQKDAVVRNSPELYYAASVFLAEDTGIPFRILLPEALGELEKVLYTTDNSGIVRMSSGVMVYAVTTQEEEGIYFVDRNNEDIVIWVFDDIKYVAVNLSGELKEQICTWLEEDARIERHFPFNVELPFDVLGHIVDVTPGAGESWFFETETGITVCAKKLDDDWVRYNVSEPDPGIKVNWVKNGIQYTVYDLSEELKDALCAWVLGSFGVELPFDILGGVAAVKYDDVDNSWLLRMTKGAEVFVKSTSDANKMGETVVGTDTSTVKWVWNGIRYEAAVPLAQQLNLFLWATELVAGEAAISSLITELNYEE